MKTMITLLLALIPSALLGQERSEAGDPRSEASLLIWRAATDSIVADRVVADALGAARKAENELTVYDKELFWRASAGILAGEFGDVPSPTIETITNAIVDRAVTGNRDQGQRALEILYDGGLNGFAGASEAMYRIYTTRREEKILEDLSLLPWKLYDQPDGRGLPYLARLATMNNDEFGEADVHNGVIGRPSRELFDVRTSPS